MRINMTLKVCVSIAFLALFCMGVAPLSFAENLPSESIITEVTVYPGSARVTRQAKVNLSAGEHSIVFENIIPRLDEDSITVTGKGVATVKIFGAYIRRDYSKEAVDSRVKELESLIQSLDDQIETENSNADILRKEREFLDSVKLFSGQQIPKDLVTTVPSIETLEGIQSFLFDGFTDVEKRKEAIKIKIRELKKEKDVAQRKLNELRGSSNKQQRQLIVDLECVKSGTFSLDVSYLVHGAYWRSVYDARANYDKEEVELTSFGMIKQTTGEDWGNVQLTLSTAKPTVSGRMPYVDPWILRPYEVRRNKEGLARVGGRALKSAMQTMAFDSNDILAKESAEVDAEMAYSEAQQKGISVVYKIVRPATIKSDGSESRYPISTQTLKADFEYSTYPRVKPFAYLGSRVENSKDFQLLAGQVNLFLDGDYIGKSSIDNIGPGEEFDLYLGVDENVKVKREQISRNVDDILIGGIKSPNRVTKFEYKLSVENYKGKNINVHLFEAIPVSQNDRIKVKTSDISVKPKDKDWKDRAGIWHWEFSLKPKQKEEITYSFTVEHPREMNIPGI